jgi:hypothetical protein
MPGVVDKLWEEVVVDGRERAERERKSIQG